MDFGVLNGIADRVLCFTPRSLDFALHLLAMPLTWSRVLPLNSPAARLALPTTSSIAPFTRSRFIGPPPWIEHLSIQLGHLFRARRYIAYAVIRSDGWTISYCIGLLQWIHSVSRMRPSESSMAWGKLLRHTGQEIVTHVSGAEP